MKNKIILFMLAGLVLLAGAIYYLRAGNPKATPNASKNNSVSAPASSDTGSISRVKTEGIILDALERQPSIINVPFVNQQYHNMGCPYAQLFAPLGVLEKAGFINKVAPVQDIDDGGFFVFADKSKQYVGNTFLDKNLGVMQTPVVFSKTAAVKVTGLVHQGNFIQADFTATNQLTPFGEACGLFAEQKGVAVFTLYDDGWRLTKATTFTDK